MSHSIPLERKAHLSGCAYLFACLFFSPTGLSLVEIIYRFWRECRIGQSLFEREFVFVCHAGRLERILIEAWIGAWKVVIYYLRALRISCLRARFEFDMGLKV